MRRLLSNILPPLLTAAIICIAIETAVRRGWILFYLLPQPSKVWASFREPGTDLWSGSAYANSLGGLAATAMNASIGFVISIVAGIALAMLLSSNRWIKQALYPYAVFFQTVPIIALAPMMIIWLGYGSPTVRGAACIASIFPIIANTYAGLISTDPAHRDLFRLYRAGLFQTTLKLRLPSALPSIFTGLRVAAGLAVIGAIVGEFIGGGGLGEIIVTSQTQQRTEKLFAAVILASLLGLAMVSAINLVSYLTLRHWHASERG
jgi:NitT/TauT family transport system permease protein